MGKQVCSGLVERPRSNLFGGETPRRFYCIGIMRELSRMVRYTALYFQKFPIYVIVKKEIYYSKEKEIMEELVMWFIMALLSAIFAALTSILAKIGIDGVNSNLATAIRTVVVVVMAWGMVFLTNTQGGITEISRKSWIFLIMSGLATGASWLCYYKALQIGDASKVVPIDKLSVVITLILAFVFLHEQFTIRSLIGCVLIGLGTLIMVL